jgi:hypothetical protein
MDGCGGRTKRENHAKMIRKTRPPAQSMPVKWWQLINELEEFRTRTGWGLAIVWHYVHTEQYEKARERFAEIQKLHGHLEPGHCRCGHAKGQHNDGRRCQGVQHVAGWGLEKCDCVAYVYSESHTELIRDAAP